MSQKKLALSSTSPIFPDYAFGDNACSNDPKRDPDDDGWTVSAEISHAQCDYGKKRSTDNKRWSCNYAVKTAATNSV